MSLPQTGLRADSRARQTCSDSIHAEIQLDVAPILMVARKRVHIKAVRTRMLNDRAGRKNRAVAEAGKER